MWTNENRARYDRDHLRYPSDLTDEEWAHVEPLIPAARRGGRRRKTNMRATFNAVMYVLSTGRQWRYLPKDLPARSTVYRYFRDWSIDGGLDRIHDALYEKCRAQAGREASPTAAIIGSHLDSRDEGVKSAEKGGPRSIRTGSTRERRSKARNDIFSSTPKVLLMRPRSFRRCPGSRRRRFAAFRRCLAASLISKNCSPTAPIKGRSSPQAVAKILSRVQIEIVKRSDQAKGFVMLPKRWIVERTIAWLNRCRRLAKDWENLNLTALMFLRLS